MTKLMGIALIVIAISSAFSMGVMIWAVKIQCKRCKRYQETLDTKIIKNVPRGIDWSEYE